MNKVETVTLLQTIMVMYPSSSVKADEMTVNVWHHMLSDLPADVVNMAVERMGATLKFPPSIADIREQVATAKREAEGAPSAGEAWAKVRAAASRYGYIRPDDARKALGEPIWAVVKQVGGWREVCCCERPEVLSAQFERRYEAAAVQDMHRIQIPASVREGMTALIGGLLAIEGGDVDADQIY